jgi:hypothetical protein
MTWPDAAGVLGGHVDLDRFDPAVAGHDADGQGGRLASGPFLPGDERRGRRNHEEKEPADDLAAHTRSLGGPTGQVAPAPGLQYR